MALKINVKVSENKICIICCAIRYLLKILSHIASGVEKPARHAFTYLKLCAYILQCCLIFILPILYIYTAPGPYAKD